MRERIPPTPALDGVRGLAVIVVLLYHHDPTGFPGGWLGVSLFFTLSGLLITDLLLTEHLANGRIAFGAFWTRRIRRLLPASLLGLSLALVVLATRQGGDLAGALTDVRAAALDVANWRFIVADAVYAGSEGLASPVQHYWSLAIEEQFYLVFPLVVAVALRRRRLVLVLAATVVASTALQLVLDGRDRVYFGTDTRAAELAVGALLAVALPGLSSVLRGRHHLADLWGMVALVAGAVLVADVALVEQVTSAGALTAVTVVWVGMLVASLHGRAVPRLLGARPLAGIGRISYGIYLYHWPVYLVLTRSRIDRSGWTLFGVRAAVTLVLAAASAVLVELPIRRGRIATRRLLPAVGLALATVLTISVIGPFRATPGNEVFEAAPPVVSTTTSPPLPSTTTTLPPAPAASVVSAPPTTPAPTTAPPRVPRLLVVGDSTARVAGEALQQVAAEDGIAEVYLLTGPGCTVAIQARVHVRDGHEFASRCGDLVGKTYRKIAEIQPDAVVVWVGSTQLFDATFDGLGDDFLSFLDPLVQDRYRERLTVAVQYLGQQGVPILWADVPEVEWDLEAYGEIYGTPLPGEGPATCNGPEKSGALNAIDEQILATSPLIARWDYTAAVAGPDGVIDPSDRPDGLHLDPDAARRFSRERFLPLLAEAYRSVLDDPDARLAGRPVTAWWPAA